MFDFIPTYILNIGVHSSGVLKSETNQEALQITFKCPVIWSELGKWLVQRTFQYALIYIY